MKLFKMNRIKDTTGVSGTGTVLEGVVFGDGVCVVRWTTARAPHSTGYFDSYDDFHKIHIASHPENQTEIIWSSADA